MDLLPQAYDVRLTGIRIGFGIRTGTIAGFSVSQLTLACHLSLKNLESRSEGVAKERGSLSQINLSAFLPSPYTVMVRLWGRKLTGRCRVPCAYRQMQPILSETKTQKTSQLSACHVNKTAAPPVIIPRSMPMSINKSRVYHSCQRTAMVWQVALLGTGAGGIVRGRTAPVSRVQVPVPQTQGRGRRGRSAHNMEDEDEDWKI